MNFNFIRLYFLKYYFKKIKNRIYINKQKQTANSFSPLGPFLKGLL